MKAAIMPVYAILCPDCGHTARSVVLAGCKMPSEWVCVHCDGRAPLQILAGLPSRILGRARMEAAASAAVRRKTCKANAPPTNA